MSRIIATMHLFRRHSLNLKSYSKINLSLHILGQREDGYHVLDSVVLPTSIHDVITITVVPYAETTTVVCDEVILQRNHHNLCLLAVEKMRERFGFTENFNISIHKAIPVSAGMGGGSSNAATVMIAINKLLSLNATLDDLKKVAIQVGADVPLFLSLSPSRITGIGETIDKIECKNDYYVLVLTPRRGLSTRDVYQEASKFSAQEGNSLGLIESLSKGGDISELVSNDLLLPANSLCPEISQFIEKLRSMNLSTVSMTGSGSAVFALSTDKKAITKAELILLDEGYNVVSGKAGNI